MEQTKYYKNLYSPQDVKTDHELNDCRFFENMEILNKDDKIMCDSKLTIGELAKNIKELPNNKSPGCDGLTTDFYKFFWIDIKEILYECYIYSFEEGKLSQDQRRAVINLIPKPNKDLRHLKNWRPLSLLNTDYKILAKTFATRLQKVIGKLVKPDQTGCISGRFIGENIRTMLDIIEYTTSYDVPGLMVLIDFEKAFDSVSWDFLFVTLQKFNFGESFVKWIKLLYSEPTMCVTNNGYASSFFAMGRGIRQGCPISALLFLLVAETMANCIRSDDGVKGISVSHLTVTISQYADDTTIFLKDEASLQAVFDILDHFGKCAGLKINKGKTEIIALGNNIIAPKVLGIRCTNIPVKALGVWIGKDSEEIIQLNFRERIGKLKTVLNIWQQRTLTLKGKVVIVNSLALSQLQYLSSVLFVPGTVIDEVNNLIFKFLWPKKAHVKKTVVTQEIHNGGLKMPDYLCKVKASKISWVKRLLQGGKCAILAKEILMLQMPWNEFCRSNFDTDFLNDDTPLFYKQLLQYWFDFYATKPEGVTEILSECIWYNKYITVDNAPIFYKNAYANGLKYINDVLDDTGKVLSRNNLNEKFDIDLSIMSYNSLYSAIPRLWKTVVKNTERIEVNTNIMISVNKKEKLIEKISSKEIYWELVRKYRVKPKACLKWENLYDLLEFDWDSIFSLPYKVSRETNLQSFQFQIIHRFFPCNAVLNKWYENHDNKCTYCNAEDTLEHYFYSCTEARSFWNVFQDWWYDVSTVKMSLNVFHIVFGVLNPNDDILFDTFNFCILYAKRYIAQQKRKERPFVMENYLRQLKHRLEYERIIYTDNMNLESFTQKWGFVFDTL